MFGRKRLGCDVHQTLGACPEKCVAVFRRDKRESVCAEIMRNRPGCGLPVRRELCLVEPTRLVQITPAAPARQPASCRVWISSRALALGRGAVSFSPSAGLYHRGRGAKPSLAGNCDHRRLIDNADGVPREQGIARLGTVDTGRNSDLELPREPGERAVTAEADTMVLGIIFLEAKAEPSCLNVGGSP